MLFRICMKELPAAPDFDKQKIYRTLTGKKGYNDKEMRYMLSSLTRCLENYLACKTLFSDEALLLQLRLKGLSARGIDKAYTYEYGLLTKAMHEKGEGDALYYLQRFLNHYQHLNYTYRKSKRKVIIRFDEAMLDLDRFYFAKKLQLFAELINAQSILAAEYKVYLIDEIKKLALEKNFMDVPVIAIYYNVLMTLIEKEADDYFRTLRQLLSKFGYILEAEELNDLFQYIRNYCIKKINLGESNWQLVLFEIYKEILCNKKILRSESFSQWEFKNITTLGLRLHQTDWVAQFIKKYSYYLRPEERKNAIIYNMANWHFHQKSYSETLKLFQKVEFTDVYYQLDTKSIQLKIYFEQDDLETLFFHGAAFKTFLSRNKLVSPVHKTIYRNLVNYTLRLARCGTDLRKISQLYQKILQTPQIADLQWLKQKTEELM